MMYPFMTLNDATEIVHSHMLEDGRVKVYMERPDEKDGFHHATCYLPTYEWEDIYGFTEKEKEYFQKLIEDTAHLILEFSQKGGFRGASGIAEVDMYGLSESLIRQILSIAQQHKIGKLVLFGSRARGDFRSNSDIDLAVYGLHPRDEMSFLSALEDLPTLLKCVMIAVRRDTGPALMREIEKDGVVLMERIEKKQQQFIKALQRLKEAVEESRDSASTVVRDGVIQRFEFTTEIAWKTCREKLLENGYVNIDSPKATMRQAYAAGMIDDEQTWIAILQARNLSSHMYSEEEAVKIYESIVHTYVGLLDRLLEKLALAD